MGRLASGSHSEATIAKLESYAQANISASDRKPIDQAINIIRVRLGNEARVKSETREWLRSHSGRPATAPNAERG